MYNTYIQQIKPNGSSYSKGSVVNLLTKYNIACQEFPFKKHPKIKELATNDWFDEDGLEVYMPDTPKVSHYDIDVTFLCKGVATGTGVSARTAEQNLRDNVGAFIDFLRGRAKGASTDTVQSARLAIYDEYVGMGRKDVVATEIDNQLFYIRDTAVDALAQFKVKFTVYDPVTEVTPVTAQGSDIVTDLYFR